MEQFFTQTPVAGFILIITLITSLYAFSNPDVMYKLMLNPYNVSRGTRVWSIFTSGLIHADFGHLFMNMLSYYFFAFTLERIIGSWQFGILYVASLALSDLNTILKHKDNPGYNSLGASGAVAAVIFSFILFNPMTSIYVYFIPMPAVIFAVLYLVYSAYSSRQSSRINHDAHFFGALAGVLITIMFNPRVIGYFFSQLGIG